MNDITLESLIQEHKDRIQTLQKAMYCYEYPDMMAYNRWLATTIRYIELKYPNDKYVAVFCEISKLDIYPDRQQKMIAILEALTVLPTVIPNNSTVHMSDKMVQGKDAINVTTNINNTNNQSQSQEQSLAVQLFIEAIKDDLTGHQTKELKAVVEEADNDLQKARPGILAKLAEFGKDVASNIVANILTNPMIWNGL